jgi:hypothetical protein
VIRLHLFQHKQEGYLDTFEKAVKKALVDCDETVVSLAQSYGVAYQTAHHYIKGYRNLSDGFLAHVTQFFHERGVTDYDFERLADFHRGYVNLDKRMSYNQKLLLSDLSRYFLNEDEVAKIRAVLHGR